ncbi:MAG: hypothetical protein ACE5FY_07765, partial [Nitrospiria bacterium]
LMGVHHSFSSDSNDFDYGTELSLLAVKKLTKNYLIGIKYARYDADKNAKNTGGTAIDTDKLWLTGQVNF